MSSIAAWPPLGSPMPYDPAFKVQVCVNEPLWAGHINTKEITIKAASIAAQIDILCRKELIQSSNSRIDAGNISTQFEGKAVVLLDQLKKCINQMPHPRPSPEDFLDSTGISRLYPRAAAYVTRPNDLSISLKKTAMDDYFSKMGGLQQLLILSHQLNSDVTNLDNHKYMAHQLALLYQCLSPYQDKWNLGERRKNIEENFMEMKDSLSTESEDEIPQLGEEEGQWMLELTSDIVSTITQYPPDLTQHMVQPGQIIRGFY